jgi:hypothetical protein
MLPIHRHLVPMRSASLDSAFTLRMGSDGRSNWAVSDRQHFHKTACGADRS